MSRGPCHVPNSRLDNSEECRAVRRRKRRLSDDFRTPSRCFRYSSDRSRSPRRVGDRFWSPRRAADRGRSSSYESASCQEQPRAVFLMGIPGAGKTTLRKRWTCNGYVDVEADAFKPMHPRYSSNMDDETDLEVHRWSVRRSVEAFENIISLRKKQDVVFDSTGSNARWLGDRIADAKHAGYSTKLCWVHVPFEIALLRNRDRACSTSGRRRRTMVPEKVILEKDTDLPASFDKLRAEVDAVEKVENWSPQSGEMERALRDLYIYPAPRTKPPTYRHGDRKYGRGPDGARSPSSSKGSRRTVEVGPWKRTDEMLKKKCRRFDWMDREYKGDREKFALDDILGDHETLLEPNKFPYQLPPAMEHWTIWRRTGGMDHVELCEYVESWLDAQKEWHNVSSWNYDDNRGMRTIDIWHVHVYFQGKDGKAPNLKRDSSIISSSAKGRSGSSASTRVPSSPSPSDDSLERSLSRRS